MTNFLENEWRSETFRTSNLIKRLFTMEDRAASNLVEAELKNEGGQSSQSKSRLLSLPAEIRAQIFAFVLGDVYCQRPLVVWDGVCVGTSGQKHPTATAILHVCRTTYEDSISILYDHTIVDVCIRADTLDDSFPRFQNSLGSIEECSLLAKLRHIQLEIAYRCNLGTIARVRDRISRLADACGRLKTIDLVFFDQSPTSRARTARQSWYADVIVKAAMSLTCEKFVDIKRNLSAKKGMNPVHWRALKSKIDADADFNEVQETFRELSFSYFEHDFGSKS